MSDSRVARTPAAHARWETIDRRRGEWIELWERLVNTDSGPGEIDGIHATYDVLERVFAGLRMATERRASAGPDVLIARSEAASPDAPTILLIGHLDTVFPAPAASTRPFAIVDGRATGPGVADMKGGVVLALAAVAALDEETVRRLNIVMICNGDEESASVDSRSVIEAEASRAHAALVFESGRPNGNIVDARRGAVRMRIDVTGVAAHSGVEPEAGANAAEAAAHHVLAVQEFGRHLDDASLTVTIVSAGHLPNIVPDSATVHLDGRFSTASQGKSIVEFVLGLADDRTVPRTTTSVSVLNERPAFPAGGLNADLLSRYSVAADEMGLAIGTQVTGGSSDGNFAAALGVPTLDGLGPIGGGYHRDDEWSDVESLIDRAAVVSLLLSDLARH